MSALIASLPVRADAQRSRQGRADTWELEIPLEEGFRRVRPAEDEEPASGRGPAGRELDEDEPAVRQQGGDRRNVFEWYADEVAEEDEEDLSAQRRGATRPPADRGQERRPPETGKEAARATDQPEPAPAADVAEDEEEEPSVAAPVIPSLAAQLRPPRAGIAELHRLWGARREGLNNLDPAAVDSATKELLELRGELGIDSLPGMAVAVVREGSRHLDRKDAADARKSADLAVALAPDLPATHWFRARALLAEDLGQVGQSLGAVASAVKKELTFLPGRRVLLANLAALVVMGLLLSGLIFLVLLTTRTIRQYVHDFHHLFPKGAARLQTGVLAVAVLVAPILLHAGLAVVIVVFAAAAWFHSSMKERVVLALTLALVSASPSLAGLLSTLSGFWDTPAEQVWMLERADGGAKAAEGIRVRAEARSAAWPELFALARHHKREGRLEPAIALYRQAAEIAPREASIHNNLGVALYAMNELQPARDSFRRATELDPALAGAWHNLSKVYFRLGEHVPGQEARRRAVDMDADLLQTHPDPEDRLNLALAESRLSSRQILSLARVDREGRPGAAEQIKIRLSGIVPADMAPLMPIAVVPFLLLASLLVSRRRPASPCVKCGRSVCPRCDPEVAGGNLCGQCVNVFQKRGAVSQRARLVKEARIRRHQNLKEGSARLLGMIIPGGGHLLLDRPVQAAAFIFFFITGCLGLILWFGPLPTPWSPGPGPGVLGLILPGLIVLAAWVTANVTLWKRGR